MFDIDRWIVNDFLIEIITTYKLREDLTEKFVCVSIPIKIFEIHIHGSIEVTIKLLHYISNDGQKRQTKFTFQLLSLEAVFEFLRLFLPVVQPACLFLARLFCFSVSSLCFCWTEQCYILTIFCLVWCPLPFLQCFLIISNQKQEYYRYKSLIFQDQDVWFVTNMHLY